LVHGHNGHCGKLIINGLTLYLYSYQKHINDPHNRVTSLTNTVLFILVEFCRFINNIVLLTPVCYIDILYVQWLPPVAYIFVRNVFTTIIASVSVSLFRNFTLETWLAHTFNIIDVCLKHSYPWGQLTNPMCSGVTCTDYTCIYLCDYLAIVLLKSKVFLGTNI